MLLYGKYYMTEAVWRAVAAGYPDAVSNIAAAQLHNQSGSLSQAIVMAGTMLALH